MTSVLVSCLPVTSLCQARLLARTQGEARCDMYSPAYRVALDSLEGCVTFVRDYSMDLVLPTLLGLSTPATKYPKAMSKL